MGEKFRKKRINVLVATDVASRGVNVVDIATVINYDCPKNMDLYIHRVGRTGRGGAKNGVSWTLLDPIKENDKAMAPQLLALLTKLRMINTPKLEQMVNGTLGRRKHKKTKSNAKNAGKSSRPSLMSTFVKASDNEMNVVNNKKRKT